MDDDTFRQGIRDRDPDVWARLTERYHAVFRRLARRILGVGMDVENAVAEMWYRALRSARRYDASRPPYPWLARICVRTCLNQRKRELRIVHDDGEPQGVADPSPPGEAREALRDALGALPRRQREVIALRYLFGVSVLEIARLIGRQRKCVEKRITRGLRRLRDTAAETGLLDLREGA